MDDGKPSFLTYEELCTISDPHFEVAKTQHVPNPAAQDPADWPPFSAHSVDYCMMIIQWSAYGWLSLFAKFIFWSLPSFV